MSDSRRLVVVVAQAAAQRSVYSDCAVCRGLYNTTEPIDAISALTRGSLHATAVAKTAQSSKTRVMGTPWRGAGAAMGFLPSCACGKRRQSEWYACRPLPCNDACTYIAVHTHTYAILPSNRCWARTQGAAGVLLRTMEHLCMTAHKHTPTPTHT